MFSEPRGGLVNNLFRVYTPHAYTYNIWLCNVVLHFIHPLLWGKWCSPLCNTLFITHQSDPQPLFSPVSPSPLLLFLLFSPHLFIKLMRLKLGPSSQGGRERAKEDTQGKRESESCESVCICICEYLSACMHARVS